MELTAREDIEAPLDRVFAEITDFEGIERQVLRRGIDVQRTNDPGEVAEGLSWEAGFKFRGKTRTAAIELAQYSAPEQMVFDSVSGGLEARTTVDLVALSRSRTRIGVTTEFVPKTLSARLLVQSLKLAKGGLDKRFKTRMAHLAKDLENRLKG
ncbi:SRPBCC family protein [uncultured Pelagimonas sp.]|uniref:SRPBCC family protein n=1 Tax=uncultured Pelagimonas sp. TaxID=1618102 RepID=UPI00261C7050|nr:SRPBCC family protein [uncultured Pelagimonas sp.]